MTDPSKNASNFSSRGESGFFSSSLFKVMVAVLIAALAGWILFIYFAGMPANQPTEGVTTETAAEITVDAAVPAEPAVVEAKTNYEYAETGTTYTLVDEGGPGPYEFTCSNIASIKTSSVLAPQGKATYATENLTDEDESTAWAEGKAGFGVGEWIEFTLTDEHKKWGYTDKDFIPNHILGDFVIQTGYAKSPAAWKKNGRPVKLKCYLNGQFISVIQLSDSPDFQTFLIFPEQAERAALKEGDVIRFEILDVVQGTNDEDACISEFHILGNCG